MNSCSAFDEWYFFRSVPVEIHLDAFCNWVFARLVIGLILSHVSRIISTYWRSYGNTSPS
jgi:hypothetical protein